MRKWIWLTLLLLLFSMNAFANGKVLILDVNGAIGPATQDYIEQGILKAEKIKASLIILKLDTPGGLETAMRHIINDSILQSPIPIATFVSPTGARAASAGTFIMYASHFAIMTPGTQIGAASPVEFLSSDNDKNKNVREVKAMNDAVAYIKSLAELRGRNAKWAELAVRNGASLTASEAKAQHVIDDVAEDVPSLLKKIDGKTTSVLGVTKKIETNNLQTEIMPPNWHHYFLAFITDPNIAYILMLVAVYGLFFELSNPGLILPGVAGLIALLLLLYAFQLMPVNYTGLALLVVGIAFMVSELYITSYGALGIGGVIAFIIGSVMIFDVADPNFHVAWFLIIAMSAVSLTFFLLTITLAVSSHKKAIITGREGLIGSEGKVISVMNKQIIVQVWGEIWEAHSDVMLDRGQTVRVIGIDGLTLKVEPVEKN